MKRTMPIIPFDDRDGVIWFDGKLMPWRDAKLHVLSHGLHYGSCVFEGERSYAGRIFKMEEHHDRLLESGRMLGFTIPYSREEIDAAAMAVLEGNGISDGYLRPVAWRGSEMMAVSAQQTKTHVAVRSEEHTSDLPVTNAHLVCRLLLDKTTTHNTTAEYLQNKN